MLSLPVAPTALRHDPSNRLGLDYANEAPRFPKLGYGIIDVHTHINGLEASAIWRPIAQSFGITRTFSMSRLEDIPALRAQHGAALEFIAVPDWTTKDRHFAHGPGYLARIEQYHELGTRIVKFWNAPRFIDFGIESGDPSLLALDGALRVEQMKLAERLGMICMTHVADPNTWFAAKYTDTARYGRKHDHYIPLRRALDRFTMPWIAAHMGGFPEDLTFLDGLLEAHPNLHLDTSATKWMVRELPRHPRSEVIGFLQKWRGRIMFGTDTVTTDEHLHAGAKSSEMAVKATSHESAFDLYASRYWALRMMWEGTGEVTSPIADPDLHMIDPVQFTVHDGPLLRGLDLPADLLRVLYHDAAAKLLQVDS
ncbi:MAG: hypothetical protein DWI10_06855 [Planctomycetota bacterium]|jgi:hypothetical protein|nr:MAG: hypothetical protein DWI10_06855 [Planctomycetota bacterium]